MNTLADRCCVCAGNIMSQYRIAMTRALYRRGMDAETIAGCLGIDAGAVENLIEDPQTPGAEPGKGE